MKFSVRMANAADAGQIAYVHYKAWMATYTGLLLESYLSTRSVERSIELFKATKCNNVVVACAADLIVGCCGLRPYKENMYEIGFHLRPAFWDKVMQQKQQMP